MIGLPSLHGSPNGANDLGQLVSDFPSLSSEYDPFCFQHRTIYAYQHVIH